MLYLLHTGSQNPHSPSKVRTFLEVKTFCCITEVMAAVEPCLTCSFSTRSLSASLPDLMENAAFSNLTCSEARKRFSLNYNVVAAEMLLVVNCLMWFAPQGQVTRMFWSHRPTTLFPVNRKINPRHDHSIPFNSSLPHPQSAPNAATLLSHH